MDHPPAQPCSAAPTLRRLTGAWKYLLFWGVFAGGLYLARPQTGADAEEHWLFAIWNVLVLSLCGHMLRDHREIPADPHAS